MYLSILQTLQMDFIFLFFSSTADDSVAQGRMATTQRDFPNFTDILQTSDNANKKNN